MFRRVRIYLPLFLILLLSMALFLPLSAPWMARRVESNVRSRAGIPLEISQLRIQVAAGQVEMNDLVVRGAAETGRQDFHLSRAQADGDLGNFLAGGGRWPERVELNSPSTLHLYHAPDGSYQIRGAWESLLEAIQVMPKPPRNDPAVSPDSIESPFELPTIPATPEMMITNLKIQVDSLRPDLPDILILVEQMRISPRHTADASIQASLRGIVTAGVSEDFNISLVYLPDEQRLILNGSISGLGVPFIIPGLGEFNVRGRDVDVQLTANLEPNWDMDTAVDLNISRFELAERAVGGQRWTERQLVLRLRAILNPRTGRAKVDQVSLLGEKVNVAGSADVIMTRKFPGYARVRIRELPPAGLAFGWKLLTDEAGVRVSSIGTTGTLELDTRIEGELADPINCSVNTALELGGWRIEPPHWPVPINLQQADIDYNNEAVSINRLIVKSGGMEANVRGRVPIADVGQPLPDPGRVDLFLNGEIEEVFKVVQRYTPIPPEVESLHSNFSIEAGVTGVIVQDLEKGIFTGEFQQDGARVSWGEGRLNLQSFRDPVVISPGTLELSPERLMLRNFRFSLRGLSAWGTLELAGNKVLQGLLREQSLPYKLELFAEGAFPQLLEVLNRRLSLPRLPPGLHGDFRLETTAEGRLGDLLASDYRLRLLLDHAGATLSGPYRPFTVDDLSAEFVVDPDLVQLRNLDARILDPEKGNSSIGLTGTLSGEELRLDANVRTYFEFVTDFLAKDLRDFVAEGLLPARGWATIRPGRPLPQAPDLIRRWIAFFQQPGLEIGFSQEKDLIIDYFAEANTEEPLTFYHRDFPIPINNIRGYAFTRPLFIQVDNAVADIGTSENVKASAKVHLGQPPTRLEFTADIENLDVNEWMEGWGERPWAMRPRLFARSWEPGDPRHFFSAQGDITADSAQFLQFNAEDVSTEFHFDSYNTRPNELRVVDLTCTAYEGNLNLQSLEMEFEREHPTPFIRLTSRFDGVDVNAFLDALLEEDQKAMGILEGWLQWEMRVQEEETYRGEGWAQVSKSAFVGNIVLTRMRNVLNVGTETRGRDTSILGNVIIENQRVKLPDVKVKSPGIDLTGDGYIAFDRTLNFIVTASFISKRLQGIPILDLVGDLVSAVGDVIVSYRVTGKLEDPKVSPVPMTVTKPEMNE